MRLVGLFAGLLLCAATALEAAERSDSVSQPRLVLVIDDMGNNLAQSQAALQLPGPISYAFLPHRRYTKQLALQASESGKDVLLHAPMQNARQLPLGPGALTKSMDESHFKAVLQASLDAVPGARGLNNHMGSLLTELELPMSWTMEVAKQRGVYFLDSRTTPKSLGYSLARKAGIDALVRDVFLDHEQTPEFVSQQYHKALAIARKYGYAIAIGHPYSVTVEFLEKALPELDEQGIQLVSASAFLMLQAELDAVAAEQPRYLPYTDCDELEGRDCHGEDLPVPLE